LGEEKVKYAETLALNYALKGCVSVRARFPQGYTVPMGKELPSPTPASSFERAYWVRATDLPLPEGASPTERFAHNPTEPLVESLHLWQWDTPHGSLFPQYFAERRPQREVNEGFVEAHLLGAMLRHGMRSSYAESVIGKQFAQPETRLSSSLTVMEVLENYTAFTSNAIQYAADQRYPNIAFLKAQDESVQRILAPQVYGETALGFDALVPLCGTYTLDGNPLYSRYRQTLLSGVLAAKAPKLGKPAFADTGKPPAKPVSFEEKCVINVESWDPTPHAGETHTSDCEDSGFGALSPLEALDKAATQARASSLVKAFARFLGVLCKWAAGATVNGRYLKDDGSSAAAKHIPLPVPGSLADKDWDEGGHAYAGLESKVRMAAKTLRGLPLLAIHGDDHARVKATLEREIREAPVFARHLPPILIEGTAPGLRWALPVEETFAGTDRAPVYVRKAATKKAFSQACRTKAAADYEVLARFFKVPSQTYELWHNTDPHQRVSPFYRTAVHLISPDVARALDAPQMTQLMAVDQRARTRGVAIADYLRDQVEGGVIALVAPFGDVVSAREWKEKVAPTQERLLALQACSSWGCLVPQSLNASARLATPEQIRGLATPQSATPLGALPKARVSPTAIAAIERADEGDTHVVLPLYAPAWKFAAAGEAKTEELFGALERLKKQGVISEWAWMRDVPMPQLPEQVELLLLLPVAAKVDEKMFPRPAGHENYGL
jgi:hypothetical protein